jgi:uncharacterized protein (TIGR00369 family)
MQRSVVSTQNVSRMCVVCGQENPWSLKARFFELADGELAAVFSPLEEHQGYPQRLHGGIASTLLDETIGRAINVSDPDEWGVTVELSVRFRKPVPLDGEVHAFARITKDSSRLFEGTGEIVLSDGTVAVEARGKYLKMGIDKIADGDFADQWFPDPRPAPATIDA